MIDGDHDMSTPVIGLDRDGTINVDTGGYVTTVSYTHLTLPTTPYV